MSFTQFIKPYPDGYEDFEVGGTPVTAEILNTNYDGFLLALNEFLPELEGMVEANPSEQATAGNLTKLKVGNSIYLIPSGGSGGSTVEWEQIQLTGTKIATITIDNVPVDVYAPSGGGSGDEVEWTQVLGSGTKIGTITINNTPIDVYAPTPIDVEANPSGSATAGDLTKLKVGSSIYSIPSGGSGGASDLSDLDDVSITNVQNGQTIKWNSTTLKWENSNESGGGSGHTIIDENGNSMTARAGLQFVGGANVEDDGTNNRTIVDLASAGGIDGVFIDASNVIVPETTYSGSLSYTATEDCVVFVNVLATSSRSGLVYIDNKLVGRVYFAGSVIINGAYYLLKKGQTLTASSQTYSGIDITYAVYGIQTGTSHSKFQPVIYSTEEREIGVWTDGKPLYQKTWIFTSGLTVSYNSWTSSVIDSTDIENIVNVEALHDDGSCFDGIMADPTDGNHTTVAFQTTRNNATTEIKKLTLQYTKISDTAGSGSWTPQGVPTHHYSTDEQIVGTWIDGSTLYEKTIDFGALPNNTTKTVAYNISNLNNIVDVKGIAFNQNGARPLPFVDDASKSGDVLLDTIKSSGVVRIIAHTDLSSLTGYVTIQYTKTS